MLSRNMQINNYYGEQKNSLAISKSTIFNFHRMHTIYIINNSLQNKTFAQQNNYFFYLLATGKRAPR